MATIEMIVTLKEASKQVRLLDIAEAPGDDRAVTIPTNESRILSAHKNTESMNPKLTPRVSSSIRDQLATNQLGIVRVVFEAEVAGIWLQRIFGFMEWVRCICELEFDKEVHFRKIGLASSLRLILDRIDADIGRKFVALGVWIRVCIDEHQFGSEDARCRDLPNVDER